MMSMRLTILAFVLMTLPACSFLGQFGKDREPTAQYEEQYIKHTVRFEGETLGIISLWYTGSPRHWKTIRAANPKLDVRKIRINQSINIPIRLIKSKRRFDSRDLRELKLIMHGPEPAAIKVVKKDIEPQQLGNAAVNDEYPFDIQSIRGCESLPNSFEGLMKCAELQENEQDSFEL